LLVPASMQIIISLCVITPNKVSGSPEGVEKIGNRSGLWNECE
jgi:hypothetical protein